MGGGEGEREIEPPEEGDRRESGDGDAGSSVDLDDDDEPRVERREVSRFCSKGDGR